MRFVDFYVVSADNVVGWSGQKMPGLNFCPSPPLGQGKGSTARAGMDSHDPPAGSHQTLL